MSRRILMRLALPALLTASLLPVAFAQSQDTQSVAEAARRAKEKKKDSTKPVKVITDDTLDVRKDDVQSAAAEVPRIAGSPQAPANAPAGQSPAAPAASRTAASTQAPKEGEAAKEPKEVTDLKEQLKQAQGDLDLLQRQLRLDIDTVYSKPDYANDKAGIARVDGEKQQVSDKQQEVDALKAKLADLMQSLGIDASSQAQAPQKPQ